MFADDSLEQSAGAIPKETGRVNVANPLDPLLLELE